MWRAVSELALNTVGWIYPPVCLICDDSQAGETPLRHGLCTNCYREVTTDPLPACPRCAQTVGPHADTSDGCGECRGAGFAFAGAVRLGPYAGKLRDAVLRLKSLGGEGLADLLGRSFAAERAAPLAALSAELVVPVPLHWWRKLMRGYNQSAALGREIAAALGAPFEPNLLRRVKSATQHAQPTRAARLQSMKDIFRVRPGARLSGKTVLLVDDVMTTGSTASAVSRALRDAGADRVVVAVMARTPVGR